MWQILEGEVVDTLFRIDQDDARLFRSVRRRDAQDNVLHQHGLSAASGAGDESVGRVQLTGREHEKVTVVLAGTDKQALISVVPVGSPASPKRSQRYDIPAWPGDGQRHNSGLGLDADQVESVGGQELKPAALNLVDRQAGAATELKQCCVRCQDAVQKLRLKLELAQRFLRGGLRFQEPFVVFERSPYRRALRPTSMSQFADKATADCACRRGLPRARSGRYRRLGFQSAGR